MQPFDEHVNASLRRRLRWAAIGFLIAFTFITVVVIADGVETRHFEALNQFARPATWRGWLDFGSVRAIFLSSLILVKERRHLRTKR